MNDRVKADLRSRIEELGPWFQNIEIGGVKTAPEHFLGDYPAFKWQGFRHVLPADLSGQSVLDIGCNAGFYAQEMKRRGADYVLGIDSDPHYLRQARFAAEQAGLDIEFREMSVYDVGKLRQRFDLVIFMGVLYHLRHPLLALDLLHEHVVGGRMLFQCLQRGDERKPDLAENYDFSEWAMFDQMEYPKLFFVEERYASDPTNWWIPNKAGMEAMLRSSASSSRKIPSAKSIFAGAASVITPLNRHLRSADGFAEIRPELSRALPVWRVWFERKHRSLPTFSRNCPRQTTRD